MKILFAKIFLTFLLFGQFVPVYAQQKEPGKLLLLRPELKHASLSYLVKEATTGKIITDFQPDLQLTPASVLKVLTTATALELLGEDYTYPTTLFYDGTIQDSILRGV